MLPWAGLPHLLYPAQDGGVAAVRRQQEIAGPGYRASESNGEGELAMALETYPWDAAEHIDSPAAAAAYFEAAVELALESGDHAIVAAALGDIARARGMSEIAREAGVTREALYKALSERGDPKLSTLLGVMRALGLKLRVEPKEAAA
jgi:probable addiction module antidote protein